MIVLRILVIVVGVVVVMATIGSAIRTVILPRAVPSRIARTVFLIVRRLFRIRAGRQASYERRDKIMAAYAPVSLLALLAVWVGLVLVAYMGMFWGLGGRSWRDAFTLSGSSVFTLGFARPTDLPAKALVFSEAALGLVLLALLITYLPALYGAFSRREVVVAGLEVRAGSPPSGVEMIERYWALGRTDQLSEVWVRWEQWFSETEESHTSFPAINFFRSPQPDHSWITAAGAVLDGAALAVSTVDIPRSVEAEFCIRAGYIALRRIAAFFGITYDSDPSPDDPISITRHEFDQACDRLAQAGVPLKHDRDQAWRDFSGWRVNYDTVLLAMAGLTMAPYAPWSSDRSRADWSPPLIRTVARRRP